MEQMEVLTSYAETTYQETVIDPGEWAAHESVRGAEAPESNRPVEGRQEDGHNPAALSQEQVDRLGSLRLQDEGDNAVAGNAFFSFRSTRVVWLLGARLRVSSD